MSATAPFLFLRRYARKKKTLTHTTFTHKKNKKTIAALAADPASALAAGRSSDAGEDPEYIKVGIVFVAGFLGAVLVQCSARYTVPPTTNLNQKKPKKT